ncbi:MAG: glycosyltransferase family 2 protein [Puniceicoccales bacterium]|jgi:glycosyltransferase involved in cell wall biosynthesis|nr:glycosyltransferase family 2 protein [Puniceicoccales bacterium]
MMKFLIFSKIIDKTLAIHKISAFLRGMGIRCLLLSFFAMGCAVSDASSLPWKPKVSIISPVYNKEKYLPEFFESVITQFGGDLSKFEIVIVDDGSTDRSVPVVQEWQRKYLNIKLVPLKKNCGTLTVVCRAVQESKGEFVLRLDPDDFLPNPTTLQLMYDQASQYDVDIVCGKLLSRFPDGRTEEPSELNPKSYGITRQPELYLSMLDGRLPHILIGQLIRGEVYREAIKIVQDIFKDKRVIYNDDLVAAVFVYKIAMSYLSIGDTVYGYRQNDDSVMAKERNLESNQKMSKEEKDSAVRVAMENIKSAAEVTEGLFHFVDDWVKNVAIDKIYFLLGFAEKSINTLKSLAPPIGNIERAFESFKKACSLWRDSRKIDPSHREKLKKMMSKYGMDTWTPDRFRRTNTPLAWDIPSDNHAVKSQKWTPFAIKQDQFLPHCSP